MRRRRNTILEALERYRAAHANVSTLHVVAFLYVCENEGLNVSELAQVCAIGRPTASRIARSLAAGRPGGRSEDGLIECRPNPRDQKGRVLYLTERGRQLRNQLETLISERRAILPIPQHIDPALLCDAATGLGPAHRR